MNELEPKDRSRITPTRIVLWVVAAGTGVFLLVTGLVGIIAKG